jgi:hypothetical protein
MLCREEMGINYTAFTRVALNGAAPEIRTSKDDMSYLSTANLVMMINETSLGVLRWGTYQDAAPTGLTREEQPVIA